MVSACKLFMLLMTMFNSTSSLTTQTIKENHSVTKFIQEAELKHGRVAMVSTLTIPTIELLNGNHQGIYQLSSQSASFQLSLLGVFACSEIAQLLKAYEYPMNPMRWFNIKEEHTPGEYGFDPLGLYNKPSENATRYYKGIEQFNGRLAMLAAFGILVQELCTDKTVIDNVFS